MLELRTENQYKTDENGIGKAQYSNPVQAIDWIK